HKTQWLLSSPLRSPLSLAAGGKGPGDRGKLQLQYATNVAGRQAPGGTRMTATPGPQADSYSALERRIIGPVRATVLWATGPAVRLLAALGVPPNALSVSQ